MFCLQHSGPLLQPLHMFLVVSCVPALVSLKSSFLPVSCATSPDVTVPCLLLSSSIVKAFSLPSTPIHGTNVVCASLSGNVCIVFTKCIHIKWNLAKYVASAGETHFRCVLCWLCLCVYSTAGPGGHVHDGAALVLVVCLLLLIYSLLIYMWMDTVPLHTHPISYPPTHSLFNRSCFMSFWFVFSFILFCFLCLCSVTYWV